MNLDNITQILIETMAEFLDNDDIVKEQNLQGIKDPILREESELHIRMANAAMEEYKKTIVEY